MGATQETFQEALPTSAGDGGAQLRARRAALAALAAMVAEEAELQALADAVAGAEAEVAARERAAREAWSSDLARVAGAVAALGAGK